MTDGIGMFEHADHDIPRREHGYCTDDVARLLIVAVREPDVSEAVRELGRTAFRFLAASQGATGRTRNRRDASGRWHGRHGVEDCWGRSVWAFGTAARRAPEDWMRAQCDVVLQPRRRSNVRRTVGRWHSPRSAPPKSSTFDPRHQRARDLLADTITTIGPLSTDPRWPWPEPRLSYANAALPEALIAAGHALDRPDVLDDGLTLLRWLLDRETVDGHLSPTPVGGAGTDDDRPRFDQQPIEVAALADACARAHAVTGDDDWRRRCRSRDRLVRRRQRRRRVDVGHRHATAASTDLTATGPNLNQGAESTLALITTTAARAPTVRSAGRAGRTQRAELVSRLSTSSRRIVAMPAPTSAKPYGSTRCPAWIRLPHEYTTFGT